MEFKGKVENVVVREGVKKDGTAWKSVSLSVKEQEGVYPQSGVFELSDKITSEFKVGDLVELEFDLSYRSYEGKDYNKLRAWKCKKSVDF